MVALESKVSIAEKCENSGTLFLGWVCLDWGVIVAGNLLIPIL
tara:strand:+ start:819 stop:947 length:129 start_codon:yes stop_codon:yes gene_type:complete